MREPAMLREARKKKERCADTLAACLKKFVPDIGDRRDVIEAIEEYTEARAREMVEEYIAGLRENRATVTATGSSSHG